MTEEELKQHIYELSYALDHYSTMKDYVALRKAHYDNIEWLQKYGLIEEYYDVYFAHIKAESFVHIKAEGEDKT